MLIMTLICTVLGLTLLVAALTTGVLYLAWVCIGVCVLGFAFLLADIIRNRKGSSKESDTDTATDTEDTGDIPDSSNGEGA